MFLQKKIQNMYHFNYSVVLISKNEHNVALFRDESNSIYSQFLRNGIRFILFPDFFLENENIDILKYNHPYVSNLATIETNLLYDGIINHFDLPSDFEGFIFINENSNELIEVFDFDIWNTPKLLESIITASINELEDEKEYVRFSIAPDKYNAIEVESELIKIEEEIIEKFNKLKEKGAVKIINNILLHQLKESFILSKLLITNDYRIILQDYGEREIKLFPLDKALYLFYLKNPEGVPFKFLSDFKHEIFDIYINFCTLENLDKAKKNIDLLTDCTNNSINEKCSRIKAAFIREMSDDIAFNYYITGNKGENKAIIINRELVVFEKDTLQGL